MRIFEDCENFGYWHNGRSTAKQSNVVLEIVRTIKNEFDKMIDEKSKQKVGKWRNR